jgi:uncharacterized membrane protein
MKKHLRYFVQGVIVVAPIAVTIYLAVIAGIWLDNQAKWLVARFMGGMHPSQVLFPLRIMGIVLELGCIYLVGRLTHMWFFRAFVETGEGILGRIPLLRTLYSSVRDMLRFVMGAKERGAGKPVTYSVPTLGVKMMGMVTCDSPPPGLTAGNEGFACVYFPLSYQIGGLTMLVPTDRLQPVAVDAATMLRLVVTGGVSGQEEVKEIPAEPETPRPARRRKRRSA